MEFKIGKYKITPCFTMNSLTILCILAVLGGVLCFGAGLLGWQGVSDTIENRMYLVGLILIYGTTGFILGRIDIENSSSA